MAVNNRRIRRILEKTIPRLYTLVGVTCKITFTTGAPEDGRGDETEDQETMSNFIEIQGTTSPVTKDSQPFSLRPEDTRDSIIFQFLEKDLEGRTVNTKLCVEINDKKYSISQINNNNFGLISLRLVVTT